MVQKVFSIYDIKGKIYTRPFFMVHNGEALRYFSDLVSDEKTPLFRHPEDFEVFHLGSFDDVSGVLTSLVNPEFLGKALDFKKE